MLEPRIEHTSAQGRRLRVLVQGAERIDAVPHLARVAEHADLIFAGDLGQLRQGIGSADIFLGWDFKANELARVWRDAVRLRWVHWSGAGVDAALFPELVASDVQLTNARGVFDRAMAEYVLALVLAFAKRLPETFRLQQSAEWKHRLTGRIDQRRVVILGIGSIGRATARLLRQVGMEVIGIGRRPRADDPDFDQIGSVEDLLPMAALADYFVNILPATAATEGLVSASVLDALPSHAIYINVGRGSTVDEEALIERLRDHRLAGAGLDVFREEPLPADHAFWSMDNVIVSPHMSGDHEEYAEDLGWLFFDNFRRYLANRTLRNIIDKRSGYVMS